jgi:hypothetical protein
MFNLKQPNGRRFQFDGSIGRFGAAKMQDERTSVAPN